MYGVSQQLLKNEDDFQRQIGADLKKYSEALENAVLDPTEPKNRREIEAGLDTLFTMENDLSRASTQVALDRYKQNIYAGMLLSSEKNTDQRVENGLKALNRLCEFGINEKQLASGNVYAGKDPQGAREAWKEKRAKDKKAAEDQAKREEAEKARQLRERQKADQAEIDRLKKAADEKKKREEAQAAREKQRREDLLRKERQRVAELNKTAEQRIAEQNAFRDHVNTLMQKARDPKTTDFEKMASMAEAVACKRELDRVAPFYGQASMDLSNINQNMQWVVDSGALRLAQKEGRLDKLAALSPEDLDKHVKKVEEAVSRCQEGTRESESGKRAQGIFRQMDRIWRLMGSSGEFKAAKQAIEEVSKRTVPSQTDHYVAAEIVKKYVNKNLGAARSDVGMTRMACSMAFLKQTMTEADFRTYCFNLNSQRGLVHRSKDGKSLTYDKADPRCFVPEEIGTIKEVYHAARERIGQLSKKKENPAPGSWPSSPP